MSDCLGELAVGCKVDKSMRDFIDDEAARCGVTRAELLRRVLDDFQDSREGGLDCPHCGGEIHLNPCP